MGVVTICVERALDAIPLAVAVSFVVGLVLLIAYLIVMLIS
ncbi:hypothetical protein [Pyrococcus kukulkanii]